MRNVCGAWGPPRQLLWCLPLGRRSSRCVREAGFQVVLVGKEHPEELRALADEVVDSYEDMTKKMC